MPNSNQNTKINAAFYHSLGKVLTESTNLVGNEKYKSAHNVRSSEVWADPIQFAPTFASASSYSDDIIVRQVGTSSNPVYLYPLTNTNYQTWFIDIGTPSAAADGFVPSSSWVKPLISPTDVPNSSGAPSVGYELKMYRRDGTTAVSYGNTYYDVDYFSGLVRFDVGYTPIDSGNGLGFTFNKTAFESTPNGSKQAYVQSTVTGGPRVIAWQYVGQRLSNLSSGMSFSFVDSSTIAFTWSGNTYSAYVIDGSLTASQLNTGSNGGPTAGYVLSVDGNGLFAWVPQGVTAVGVTAQPVYQLGLTTSTGYGETGLTLSMTPVVYSRIQVFVNGQLQSLGNGITTLDCHFGTTVSAVSLSNLQAGDQFVWNDTNAGFQLSTRDKIDIIYEA